VDPIPTAVKDYAYYGITGNMRALSKILHQVQYVWWKWLSRRSHRARMSWSNFSALWSRNPLPAPRIVHSALRSAKL
jgi:RNA-directed DNA polymerase